MPVIVTYNELNRLIHAMGKTKSATYDMAMTFGLMSEPLTKVQKVDSSLKRNPITSPTSTRTRAIPPLPRR